jgi:outer membrane protein OmpA-like peptidoglycan-associated protein
LKKLLGEGKYKAAYRQLVISGEYSCGNYRYAEVLKWNGRYKEALEVLKGQGSEEATELRHELEGFLGMRKKDELYSIRAYGGNDSISQSIFAVSDAPILMRKVEVQTSSFPRKTTEEKVFFESTSGDSTLCAELSEEFSRMQEKHRLQFSTGWFSTDTLLYYSAFYQAPLSMAGFHNDFGIYKWDGKKHELLEWIDKDGAYVHPTITKDGWLIFSSDCEGGFGGMDLWKINLSVDQGEPINLGAMVNSEYDEIYPAEAGDSLYFATNDPERSFGGLDILLFYDGKISNPGKPLNSLSDDFNPCTVKSELAYLCTDRLYPDSLDFIVKVKPFKSRLLFDVIHGEVKSKEIVAGEKVELLDSDGNLLDYTFVNEGGRFTFASIKGLEDYTLSFGEGKMEEGDRVLLFDKNFSLVEQLELDQSGQAKFELLTPEDYFLEKVVNTDESMLSVDIAGMLSGSEAKNGVEIFLQDSEGKTIARAFTNAEGEFIFEQVTPDEAYTFKSAAVDINSEIRIFNQNGEVIERIKPGGDGKFVYIRLKESDKIITITNEENVTMRVAEDEKFNLPAIYFEFDEFELDQRSNIVLNNLISILEDNPHVFIKLAGHTDSKGDAIYNLRLSGKRIESVKNYLVKSGIESRRISGLGFGETQLVNQCADNVDCTEEQHAENRRIEVQFSGKK